MAATLDGSEEPLFADDLDDYSDDEPPPLPPPIVPGPRNTPLAGTRDAGAGPRNAPLAGTREVDAGLRIGTGSQPSTGDGRGTTNRRRRRQPGDANTGGEEGEDGEDAPPKKVRKPVLTFKMDSLFSEKGFPYLVQEFPKLKFKGKGEEVKDLKLLLQQYEEWANQLFPKLTFHDFCKRIESMSKKNTFRSQLNTIRRKSANLDNDSNEEEGATNDIITERLSPELEDSDPRLSPELEDSSPRLSPELEDSSPRLSPELEDSGPRLSPELEDSGPRLSPEPEANQSSNMEVEPTNEQSSEQQAQAAGGSTPREENFIPNPWDIVPEDERSDVDPYEDFPEL